MQIKKYLDTSRRGLICFQKYKILTEARLTVALKNCGQFKIFPQIIKICLRISYNRLSRLPYLGALSICQNWPASRLDYQPLFGKMSPHSFPRKRMRIKDRTRETAEIEPNRPDHSCDSVELRILLWLSSQIINIMQEEMVFSKMSSTGRPVLTFGNRPKLFQNRLLTSKIISLPCTDNVVYLFNLLSTNFYSATLLKNSFIWLFSECFSELYAQQNLFETLLAVKIKSRMNV